MTEEKIIKPGESNEERLRKQELKSTRASLRLSRWTLISSIAGSLVAVIFQGLSYQNSEKALLESRRATENAIQQLNFQRAQDSISESTSRQMLAIQENDSRLQKEKFEEQLRESRRSTEIAQEVASVQIAEQKRATDLEFRPVLQMSPTLIEISVVPIGPIVTPDSVFETNTYNLLRILYDSIAFSNQGKMPLRLKRLLFSVVMANDWQVKYSQDPKKLIMEVYKQKKLVQLINDVIVLPGQVWTKDSLASESVDVTGIDFQPFQFYPNVKVSFYPFIYVVYEDMWGKEYSLFRMTHSEIFLSFGEIFRSSTLPFSELIHYRWDILDSI